MKTNLILMALATAGLTLTTSCESCSKKTSESTAVADTTAAADQAYLEAVPDTVATAAQDATATSSASGGKSKGKSGAASSKTNGNESKSGYSAPNGTDAENNDGDQYTRNDQKPMPTGTSIK